jgi:hypothetical protein
MTAPARTRGDVAARDGADPPPAPIAPEPPAARDLAVEALAALFAEMKADQDSLRAEIGELRAMIAKPEPPSWAPPGKELLATVAARLGYSAETVRLWCCSGAVDALRRGGVWYVSPESAADCARRR